MRLTYIAALIAGLSTLQGCALLAGGAAATGVLMVDDRRSSATYVMDEEIELKAAGRLREMNLTGSHANFTSFNRRVLITGETASETTKAQIGEMVRGVANVTNVYNELAIAAPSSLTSRTADGYTTAKVKTRFLDDKRFSANHVKVVTENDTTYLMGVVKHDEALAAAEVAAKTSGVKRVVKVFEYLD